MKKILFSIILFISINIYGQKNVTLFFRNGDSLKVISHLNSGDTRINYKVNEGSKKIKVDYKKIKKAVKYYKSFKTTYTFKIKQNYSIPVLLEQVTSGKIYLYKLDFTRNSNLGGMTMSSNNSEYYVCKDDEDVVTRFNASGIFIENGFRKKSNIVFKDCPYIIEKINNKMWKMKDIPKIVDYYNKECNTSK